jgi:hypothetical protein
MIVCDCGDARQRQAKDGRECGAIILDGHINGHKFPLSDFELLWKGEGRSASQTPTLVA